MAVALVAGTPSSTTLNTGVGSQTWSYNAGASTSYTCLIVTISTLGGIVSGITYNSVAFTHASGSPYTNANNTADVWYLPSPATGANNLIVSWSSQPTDPSIVGAVVFYGVNQTTPLGTSNHWTGSGAKSASITIPANGGGIDCCVGQFNSAPTSPSQTQLYATAPSGGAGAGSQYSLTAGSQSFGWTTGSSSAGDIMYPINPVAAGSYLTENYWWNNPYMQKCLDMPRDGHFGQSNMKPALAIGRPGFARKWRRKDRIFVPDLPLAA